MQKQIAAVVVSVAVVALGADGRLLAQQQQQAPQTGALAGYRFRSPKPKQRTPPPTVQAAAAGDLESVLFNWMWYMGMLRGPAENEAVAMTELRESTGTLLVDGQPCTLTNYRRSTNFQTPGERNNYSCTRANGQKVSNIEVVSGEYAWDEDVLGAGLVPGRGTPVPKPATMTERQIRIWASPQGAAKAAAGMGSATKVAVEGGKAVVTFPLPGMPTAMAKATLNAENMTERVEVRQGTTVTEFTYANYADHNPEDDRIEAFFPGRMTEKRNGTTVLDLTTKLTHMGNLYIIMPVPDAVRKAAGK